MTVVLLIESDALQARWIHDNLRIIGYDVIWKLSDWDSFLTISSVHPDLIIVDDAVSQAIQHMIRVRALRNIWNTPIIFLSSNTMSRAYDDAPHRSYFMDKPINAEHLIQQVQHLIGAPLALPSTP